MKIDLPVLAACLATFSGAALATEYGTVISVMPVVVQVRLPQQLCTEQQALVQPRTSGGGQLLGALIGGVVGHNLGGGSGRVAATGLGVVAGSIIGDQAEAANTPPSSVPLRRCQNTTRLENQVQGYDVTYEYDGQRKTVRMAQAPGERVELGLAVVGAVEPQAPPVEASPPPAPAVTAPAQIYVEPAAPYAYYPYYGYQGYYGYVGPSVAIMPSLVIGGSWRWHRGYGR
jgi:uncharacterized protein YcfJ